MIVELAKAFHKCIFVVSVVYKELKFQVFISKRLSKTKIHFMSSECMILFQNKKKQLKLILIINKMRMKIFQSIFLNTIEMKKNISSSNKTIFADCQINFMHCLIQKILLIC